MRTTFRNPCNILESAGYIDNVCLTLAMAMSLVFIRLVAAKRAQRRAMLASPNSLSSANWRLDRFAAELELAYSRVNAIDLRRSL